MKSRELENVLRLQVRNVLRRKLRVPPQVRVVDWFLFASLQGAAPCFLLFLCTQARGTAPRFAAVPRAYL